MKIHVRFKYNDSSLYPCAALVDVGDRKFCAVAESWDKAETEVIERVKIGLGVGDPPQAREIEIPCGVDAIGQPLPF